MKIIFTAFLIFLFISCSNNTKHITDNDPSAENPDTDDIENVDYDTDPEPDDEPETDEDTDNDNECDPAPDEDQEIRDEDTEPVGICAEKPCENIAGSDGTCLVKGEDGDYVCQCKENYVWLADKKECAKKELFKGLSCTGQTKCYDNEKEIPCPEEGEPFFGQDANYAEKRMCLPQNFTIKHYGAGRTVIDNNSGLEWLPEIVKSQTSSPQAYIDNPAFEKYSDWRSATTQDLNSIVDSGTFSPAINEAYFPDASPMKITSNSTVYMCPGYGYKSPPGGPPEQYSYCYQLEGINFNTGLTFSNTYGENALPAEVNLRKVRDTSEKTGSCSITLQSDDYKIVALIPQKLLFIRTPEEGKNWEEALEYCENLTYAGISDWRLPNRNEAYFSISKLRSQYESLLCWSSTTYAEDPTKALFYSAPDSISTAGKITGKANANCCVAFDPCPGSEIWTGEKCVSTEEIVVKEGECGCSDGYTLENSQCVKICDDNLCKDKAHSTGLCLNVQEKDGIENVSCQCEENYFLNENFECVNPCDAAPCQEKENSDGTCVPTGASSFTCGCKKGYYLKSNKCIAVNSNDCFIDYTDNACVNNIAGLMWSSTSSSFPPSTSTSFQLLRWSEAKKYCENHEEAGYTDWRLPKVEELWTFAKSCNNIPKESCEASEKTCCLSEECISQCRCKTDLENDGVYPYNALWSSSFKSDDPDKVIMLYSYYYVLEFRDIKKDYGLVKCVRNIE